MIEILDNEYKQEEVLPKIEPDQKDGEHHTAASKQGETRRSGRVRIANRQFEDYELYVTVEEEEVMLGMVEEDPALRRRGQGSVGSGGTLHYGSFHRKRRSEEEEKEVQAQV